MSQNNPVKLNKRSKIIWEWVYSNKKTRKDSGYRGGISATRGNSGFN